MRYAALCVLLLSSLCFGQTATEAKPAPSLKSVTLFVEGDSSVIPKFINVCRSMGPERGLAFKFVDKLSEPYDYRVILSAEGSSTWDFSHGNLVVMNAEQKVVFAVTRANRWTAKGTTNALAKEFVKVLARYLGTHD